MSLIAHVSGNHFYSAPGTHQLAHTAFITSYYCRCVPEVAIVEPIALVSLFFGGNSRGYCQGGRRYFSRREITALVGGPCNMAVYRHILVVPPTAKVLPPKNEKPPIAKILPPYCITSEKYRHIVVLPLPPKKYREL